MVNVIDPMLSRMLRLDSDKSLDSKDSIAKCPNDTGHGCMAHIGPNDNGHGCMAHIEIHKLANERSA